jgi:hypothetical protein
VDIWSEEHGRLTNYRLVIAARGHRFYDPLEDGVCVVRDATHWMPVPGRPVPTPLEGFIKSLK